jgi:hypothetical protein
MLTYTITNCILITNYFTKGNLWKTTYWI